MQSKLNSLKGGRCSFIFHHPTCSYNHPYNHNQQSPSLLQLILTSIFHLATCSQNHSYNPHLHYLPLYLNQSLPRYFYIQQSLQSPLKTISPTLTIQPIQAVLRAQWASLMWTDTFALFHCFRKALSFPKAWTGITALTITDSLSLRLRKLVQAFQDLYWKI